MGVLGWPLLRCGGERKEGLETAPGSARGMAAQESLPGAADLEGTHVPEPHKPRAP